MTAAGALGPGVPVGAGGRVGGDVWNVYRAESRKLSAQLATRLLALVCLVGPFAFAVVLNAQSGTPADTLMGAWVHASGFAISLVVLGFCGAWGFPLMAGVLVGDMFSAEDRYGTWKTVLTRSVTRRELFAGKVLAAGAFSVALLALVTISSLAAGLVVVGAQSLVGLDGVLMSPGHCLALVLISWAVSVLPMLAFTSLAVLFSVASRNGIVGVLGPALVALVTQLLGLIGKGIWVHVLLVGSAFDGWHGLFTTEPFFGPLVVSSLVSVVWIVACLGASWAILRRRDFSGTPVTHRLGWVVPVRVVGVVIVVIALLAVAGNWGPVGVTRARLQDALAPEFNNITLLQQRLFGRQVPAGAQLAVRPNCNKRGSAAEGPGDWACTLDVYIPRPGRVPFQQTIVSYDVSVQANGCFKAQSPPAFVGQQTIRDAHGHSVVNPLFVVYGCLDPL